MDVRPENTYLTPKLVAVNKSFSMGIHRRVMTLSEAGTCYGKLRLAVGKAAVDIGDGELAIGTLEAVPPVFVQKNSTVKIRPNEVLKNNFENGKELLLSMWERLYRTIASLHLCTVERTSELHSWKEIRAV